MKKLAVLGLVVVLAVGGGIILNKTVFSNNKVLAVVDGHEITEDDFRDFLQDTPPQFLQLPEALLKQLVMDQLISGILIDREVEKLDLASEADVRRRIEAARTQILRDVYLQKEMERRMTDEAIRARYEQEIADFQPEQEIRARHIIVETEQQARDIIRELNDGGDFASLAAEHSTGPSAPKGGDLGYFTRDAMVEPFAEAAFALEVGSYTVEPVQTQYGWHVIKSEDRRDRAAPTFDQARDYIQAELSAETMQQIVEELQAKADIQRFYQED